METLTNYNDHVPKTGSRMLITQFPDDESYSGVTHSDAHSEGGATLYSHVIDSPIPEENEDDVSGRFSRKTNQSNRSKDKRADNENTMGRQSGLSSGDFNDKVSETYERGGGGGEGGVSEEEYEVDSYPDSMSMDNLSETLSVTFEAPELRDEDFDTDLEVDDDSECVKPIAFHVFYTVDVVIGVVVEGLLLVVVIVVVRAVEVAVFLILMCLRMTYFIYSYSSYTSPKILLNTEYFL